MKGAACRKFACLLILLLLIFIVGCSSSAGVTGSEGAQGGAPIKIGYLAGLSGGAAAFGEPGQEGVMLAVEEINAAGGINGRPIQVVIGDDKGDPATSVQELLRLAQRDRVVAIVSASISTAEMARMESLVAEEVVELVTVSSDPRVVEAGRPYALRNEINSDVFAGTIAKYAVEEMQLTNIAMLVLNDAWGKSLAGPFTNFVTKSGGNIIAEESYEGTTREFKDLLMKIKSLNPDALFMASLAGDSALIAKQAREIGLDAVLLGANVQSTPQFIDVAGPAAEGVIFSVAYLAGATGSEEERHFLQAYEAKYGKEPNTFAAHAYDAVYMLAEGLKQTGGEKEGLRDALMSLKDLAVNI